ncbi:hypothetical protein [Flavobacterium sp. NRK1]|uniref:hypothetical protein n=1 Tax=Flavobacterium sp. NRK1 TaxID=2954929 RepID=UPI0020925628|nr:hypothetical protein [Flavobacterium sp. NRK1]MCO6148044.1 hypothetical protein [Flavobacterium sp. NRK1]
MQKITNGTNYPIEFMRIVGVILITFTHIRHNFTHSNSVPYFVLETLPRYGTLLLSIISGYLFCMNPTEGNLLNKKIKSLLIPYLIANLAVILPVLLINAFGYNFLNRLTYDYTLITEGLFSLHKPPINPPTYFIRDLFIVFCFLSLTRKHYWALAFIIPLLIFGNVLLRYDIPLLFLTGFIIKKYNIDNCKKLIINAVGLPMLIAAVYFYTEDTYKYIIAILFFINFVSLNFTFVKTGGYTYLLHLYHSPMMVFLYPILHKISPEPYFEAIAQIGLAVILCYIIFLILERFKFGFVVGNRI